MQSLNEVPTPSQPSVPSRLRVLAAMYPPGEYQDLLREAAAIILAQPTIDRMDMGLELYRAHPAVYKRSAGLISALVHAGELLEAGWSLTRINVEEKL